MKGILISVVIPCYNGRELLEKHLPVWTNLLQKEGFPFEIIIPDDASSDGSAAWIQANFPEVIMVASKENTGFSGNFNRGATLANGTHILAFNTDVEPIPGFLSRMLDHFADQNVFAVGAQLKGYDHKIQDAGKWPDFHFTGIRSTRDFIPNPDLAVETWFCSAACCLYDAQKFKNLGGFDELFNPFYFEDADLCYRAWCKDWKSIYEPRAQAFHPNSVTIKKHHTSQRINIIANRNKLFINFRYLHGTERLLFILLLLLKLMTSWAGKSWFYESFQLFLNDLKEFKQKNKLIDGKKLKTIAVRIRRQESLKNTKIF